VSIPEESIAHHPGVSSLSPAERYHFEVYGYVLLKNHLPAAQVRTLITSLRNIEVRGEKFVLYPDCDPDVWAYLNDPWLLAVHREVTGGEIRLNSANASILRPSSDGAGKYSFHLGARLPWGGYTRNGLFHASMTRTLTYLTDVGPRESTAFIAGSHKLSEEVSQDDIIQCAYDDPSLIHTVTAKAGSTVLFSETLIHSAPAAPPETERIMITGVYSPPVFQAYNGYDVTQEMLDAIEPDHRSMVSGSKQWEWKRAYRPSLKAAAEPIEASYAISK
jgi:hypothetical protein